MDSDTVPKIWLKVAVELVDRPVRQFEPIAAGRQRRHRFEPNRTLRPVTINQGVAK